VSIENVLPLVDLLVVLKDARGRIKNIRPVSYAHLNNKVEDEWKSLAFGRRGTYNPANREKRSRRLCVPARLHFSWSPARKPGIPKQDPDETWSRWNAVAAKC
jgi:hypothetical protein